MLRILMKVGPDGTDLSDQLNHTGIQVSASAGGGKASAAALVCPGGHIVFAMAVCKASRFFSDRGVASAPYSAWGNEHCLPKLDLCEKPSGTTLILLVVTLALTSRS